MRRFLEMLGVCLVVAAAVALPNSAEAGKKKKRAKPASAAATASPKPTATPKAAASPKAAATPKAATSPKASVTTKPAASPAAAASAAANPTAAASRRPRLAVEVGPVGYVRWSARRFDPVAPGLAVTVLRDAGPRGFSFGVGVGWRHHTGGRTFEEYRGRVLPPYVADVEAVPLEGIARYSRPVGRLTSFLQVGGGMEYARSSFARADRLPRRTVENDWAPTFSSALGVELPLAGGQLGTHAGVRFARHAFAAHDFELLHGVEGALTWRKSF